MPIILLLNQVDATNIQVIYADYDAGFSAEELTGNTRAVVRRRGCCEFSALWSHFVSGIKEPVDFRRNGATL
jgi:hypothetical protein